MRFRSNTFFQLSRRPDRFAPADLRAGFGRCVPFVVAVLLAMVRFPDFYFVTLSGFWQRAANPCHAGLGLGSFESPPLTRILVGSIPAFAAGGPLGAGLARRTTPLRAVDPRRGAKF